MPVDDLSDSKVNFNTLSTFTPEGELWLTLRGFDLMDQIQVAKVMKREENFIECYPHLILAEPCVNQKLLMMLYLHAILCKPAMILNHISGNTNVIEIPVYKQIH